MLNTTHPTVVSCRSGAHEYVLLTFDLDQVHAWGGPAEMAAAGVGREALELADRIGCGRLTEPPGPGDYPWAVSEIQHGDWMIDRARATEYCACRASDDDPDLTEFLVGWTQDALDPPSTP